VKIPSKTNREFWLLYGKLPPEIRALASKNYMLWKENAFHPSLHFKRINPPRWSVRIGQNYRGSWQIRWNDFLLGVDRVAF
jgi:hypothetical protein